MKKIIMAGFVLFAGNFANAQHGIIGGDVPAAEAYPWMCSTILDVPLAGCGASLIRPQWVLTAAHCELSEGGIETEQVLINSLHLNLEDLEAYSELIDVAEFIVHEDFDTELYTGPDIALIRLREPSTITPVELAGPGDEIYFEHGDPALAMGWGIIGEEHELGNDTLLTVNCRFFSPDTCEALYDESESSFYDLNAGGNICAGYFEGDDPAGAASGDSGGPLLFEDEDGNYRQVGVVSGGEFSLTTLEFPGVFTLVPAYLDWIETTIADYELALSIEAENREKLSITYQTNRQLVVNGLDASNQYEINLFDLMGNQVRSTEIVAGIGGYNETVSDVPQGVYLVQVLNKSNGRVTVERFVMN